MKQVSSKLMAGVLAVSLAPVASAQSLGDVARKEEARRKTVAGSGKVYTNDKLRGDVAPARPAAASSSAPDDKSSGTDKGTDKPADKPAPKDQAYWRDRMTKAREGIDRAKAFAEALQSQINGLSAEFTARDDPRQRAIVGEKRQKALDELARVNKEISELDKGIRDLEEEARKAGVPPGWLR